MRRSYRLEALVIGLMCFGWLAAPADAQTINFRDKSSAGVVPTTINFRAAGTVASNIATTITPGLPGNTGTPVTDDLLIAVVEQRSTLVAPTMAGWTQLYSVTANLSRGTLFWKRAAGGDATTITQGTLTSAIIAQIIRFDGVDWASGSPFDVAASGPSTNATTNTTVSAPAITPVTEDARLVFVAHMSDNHSSISLPSPGTWTQAFFSCTIAGADAAIAAHYSSPITPPALQGPFTATVVVSSGGCGSTTAADFHHGAVLALRPKPVNLSIPRPPATVADDVMIASIALRSTNAVITPPAGWAAVMSPTPKLDSNFGTPNSLAVYWKRNTGEAGPYIFGISPAAMAAGGILSFYNVDWSNPIDAQAGQPTPSANTHSTPDNTVSATVDGAMLVASFGVANPDQWCTVATNCSSLGMTEGFDVLQTNVIAGLNEGAAAYWAIQPSAGPIPAKTAYSDTIDGGNAHILALRPICATQVSDPTYVAANAQNGQVTLYWSGENVVILEKTSAFTTEAPTNLTIYSVGNTGGSLGTAVVRSVGTGTNLPRTPLSNGTIYYYRVFVNNGSQCYSPGTAINATPNTGTGAPAWSYAMTAASMAPAGLDPWSQKVVSVSNDKKVHGISETVGTLAFTNGPFSTNGPIQSRAAMLPSSYRTPLSAVSVAYVASQDGYAYAVRTDTGAQVWKSALLGTTLQGGAEVWIQKLKSLTFTGGVTSDVVFVGTSNTGDQTGNKVYALNGADLASGGGTTVWTFAPGNMDIISSTPYVDYQNNTPPNTPAVWVTSRSKNGNQASVWKLRASDGTFLASWNNAALAETDTSLLAGIDSSPSPSSDGTVVYVGTNAGNLKAIRVSDGAVRSHTPISTAPCNCTGAGAVKGMPWALSYGPITAATPDTIIFTRNTTVHSVNFDGLNFLTPSNWTTTLKGVSLAQSTYNTPVGTTTGASVAATFTNPVTAGNLIAVFISWGSTNPNDLVSVTDSLGNAYTILTFGGNKGIADSSGLQSAGIAYAKNIAGGANTVTANFSSTPNWRAIAIHELRGADQTAPLDGYTGQLQRPVATTADAVTSGSITTTANGDYIFGATSNQQTSTITGGTGHTIRANDCGDATVQPIATEDRIQSAAGPIASTFTVSVTGGALTFVMAFKAASGGLTVSTPVDDGAGHLYIGASDGRVHQLDLLTGTDQKQMPGNSIVGTMGDPTFNVDLNAIHVGGSDGHIYTFTTPF